MKTPPPLPKKTAAVFHHPIGFELYDALAMDLHAMMYAEPMLKDIERMRVALEKIAEVNPDDTSSMCWVVKVANEALMTLNVKAQRTPQAVRWSDVLCREIDECLGMP